MSPAGPREGGRTHKTPTKGGHCQGRGNGGPAGEPTECPSPPAPTAPQLRCRWKGSFIPLGPWWEAMQMPSIPGHGPSVPPREAGGGGGEHGVPQPPEPAPPCWSCSPPSSLPFPLPGKPDLRGQTGRSHSGWRSSPHPPPHPPAHLLHFRAFYGHCLRQDAGSCQAGGRDTGRVTWGCPAGGSPRRSLALGPCVEQQRLWGHCIRYTSKFTLCLLPCTETDGARASPKYLARVLQTPQWKNCSTKSPFPCHGTGLNSPVRLWREVLESWWAEVGGGR